MNTKQFDALDKILLGRIGAVIDDDIATVDAEITILRTDDPGGDLYVLQIFFGRDQLDIPIRRSTVLQQFNIKTDDA